MSWSLRAKLLRRLALVTMLAACGTRTGLFVDDMPGLDDTDDVDGSADGSADARRDAPGLVDAEPDVLPLIDAAPRDANRTDCPDAEATRIYLISATYDLYSYAPESNDTRLIGRIACPTGDSSTPFSMAVDRKGVAYVVFDDGRLYRVSTLTAACIATSFVPNQQGFSTFGMGFATNTVGPTESLYIAGTGRTLDTEGFGRIDTTSFALTAIASGFTPPIRGAELTGTGDGRLFGFYAKSNAATEPPMFIGEISTTTAAIIAETPLPGVTRGQGWAFAFWGGDFYTFTAPGGSTVVQRYRPSDGSITQVGSVPTRIVGAGVSTCAPAQ